MGYDVRHFGARGDGASLDHAAVQAAVDRCHADGGGVVTVPAGRYLCGSVRLRSNVCLFLEMGAALLAASDPALYAETRSTPDGGQGGIRALLWADGEEDVSLAGPGAVDGRKATPLTVADRAFVPFRPRLVLFRNCRRVKVTDVTLRDADQWTLHLLRCDGAMVRGVSILNCTGRINSDGIDPDGCRNVIISDCRIVAGDDCIVIKSTEGDPCENITVTNCILSTPCAALKIGTEGLSDIRNVVCSNCVITDTGTAVALYMKDGSTYENIAFSDLVIEARGQFPLLVDVTPRDYRQPRKGLIRNVRFDGISVTGPGRCYIEGLRDRPVENVSLRNVTWNITDFCDLDNACKPAGGRQERDPEAVNYAVSPYHVIAVYVQGLEVSGFRLYDRKPDATPDRGLFYLRGVREAHFDGLRPIPTPEGLPPVALEECAGIDGRDAAFL
jgi:hypothetical protein